MKPVKPVKHALSTEEKLLKELTRERNHALKRFPLLFTLLTTFGITTTFYGFEHIIDQIPWLVHNPLAMLAVGLGSLMLTGALYKKLG